VKPRYYIALSAAAVIAAVIAFWDWDWFIPPVEQLASSAVGRGVTIAHLHVHLSLRPTVTADDVVVANPDGFNSDASFARIDRLQVQVDVPAYVRQRVIIIPTIVVGDPDVELRQRDDGQDNWHLVSSQSAKPTESSSPPPQIGEITISGGRVHVIAPKLKSDFIVDIATRANEGAKPQLLANAKGTYSGQPITGQFVGGALLSLRDKADPYPIDLKVQNGPTHVDLDGTVEDPIAFAGANLKLHFAGPDLALLYPLIGIAIPQTPSYEAAGQLSYTGKEIRMDGIAGRIGESDIEGDVSVDRTGERPHVNADLRSRNVDLADLGGVVGSTPGRLSTPGQTPEQREAVAKAEANPRLIPNVKLSLPKLRAADVDLKYHGARIEGRSVPFDTLTIVLTIRDGNVDIHPVSFGIGRGEMSGNIQLADAGDALRAKANVDFRQIELARLMKSATNTFGGSGIIGGRAALEGTGASLADMLDNGTGEVKILMRSGGDLSALLVDLSGLEFGNALLSALGLPRRTTVDCLVGDFALEHGVVDTRALVLDTSEANVTGAGDINLRTERLDMQLRTQSKHFSIGSLPAPIDISGSLKHPSVAPDAATLAARGGAAVALGVLLTPLAALLPTIQFGTEDADNCSSLVRSAQAQPSANPQRRTR
jgi:AsmA family protein